MEECLLRQYQQLVTSYPAPESSRLGEIPFDFPPMPVSSSHLSPLFSGVCQKNNQAIDHHHILQALAPFGLSHLIHPKSLK